MNARESELRTALVRVGEKATREPHLLGHALRRAQELEGLGDVAQVVRNLRAVPADVEPLDVARLCLCRRPTGLAFARDAGQIASAFDLDAARLISLLRRVDAADHAATGSGLLAARATPPAPVRPPDDGDAT